MIATYNGISPQIAKSAFIAEGAQVIGDVHIGEHSSVWFNCVLRGDCYHIEHRMGELLDECEQLSNIIARSIVTAKENKDSKR